MFPRCGEQAELRQFSVFAPPWRHPHLPLVSHSQSLASAALNGAQCVMVFEQTIFCRSSTMVKRWHTTQQSCERQPRALQLWSTLGHTPTMFLQTLEILLVNYRDILSTCDHTDDKDWHERLWQSHNREVKPNDWLLPTHTNKNNL